MVGELSPADLSALQCWSAELDESGDLKRAALLQRVVVALRGGGPEPTICIASERDRRSVINHGLDVTLNSDLAQTIKTVKVSQVLDEAALNAVVDQGTMIRASSHSVLSPSQGSTTTHAALHRGISGDTLDLPQRFGFVAAPRRLYVRRETILRTRFGVWLKHRNLMRWALILVATLLALVSMFLPLSTLVPEDGPLYMRSSDGGSLLELRIRRPGRFTCLSKQALGLVLWFLLSHHMNKEIFFSVLRTFECVVIVGSFVVGEVAKFYMLFDTWGRAGYFDEEWVVLEILGTCLVIMPCSVVLATMDSWKVLDWVRGERRCFVKISLTIAALAYFTNSFFDCKLGQGSRKWPTTEACVGHFCVIPRDVFAASELQKIIFCGKAMVKYGMGWPFAFIRPRYDRPDEFQGSSVVALVSDHNRAFRHRLMSLIRPQAGGAATVGGPPDEPAPSCCLGAARTVACKAPGQPAVGVDA